MDENGDGKSEGNQKTEEGGGGEGDLAVSVSTTLNTGVLATNEAGSTLGIESAVHAGDAIAILGGGEQDQQEQRAEEERTPLGETQVVPPAQ